MSVKKLIASLIAIFLLSPLTAQAYYNPGPPSGYVNDFADMMPADAENALEGKLQAFKTETSNELAVVTIEKLDNDTIEHFASELFADWGIGTRNNDNGVLILIAKDDRQMRIEVGYGLEGALTDAKSFAIINDTLKPEFQAGDYAAGINAAVDDIIAATNGEYQPAKAAKRSGVDWELVFMMSGFVLVWLASILGRTKSWWAGGVIGLVVAGIITLVWGLVWWGIMSAVLLVPGGLLFDYFVSKNFQAAKTGGRRPPWWGGGMWGPGGGFGGGGFGGFGGGMSGGGGASGGW